MPSDVEIVFDSSLTEKAKYYTASADGYIVITASASSNPNVRYVRAFCNNRKYGIFLKFSDTDNQTSSIMFVSNGDIIEYDSSGPSYFNYASIKFIYSIKSAKKLGLM